MNGTIWFQLTLLLFVAVLAHFLVNMMKQPMIVGEILVGVIIGFVGVALLGDSSIINVHIFGQNGVLNTQYGIDLFVDGIISEETVKPFAEIGSIILLFMIGLECDLRRIYTKRNMLIALGGVIVPWFVGFLVFEFLMPSAGLNESIFVGTILVATSVAVTAAVLKELGAISSSVGSAILGAAVVDDVLGMIVLAISKGAVGGTFDIVNIVYLIIAAIVFLVGGILIGTKFLCKVVDSTENTCSAKGMRHTGFILALAIAFGYAFVSELIGISAIVGAFVAGTIFASISCKKDFEEGANYLSAIFVPVFFVSSGILFDVVGLADIFVVTVIITLLAMATKIIGCGIPARLLGMSGNEAVAVGIGMAPRLEVAIVIALYGLQNKIIGQDVYSMAIFIGIATALVTPSILRWALKKANVQRDKATLPTIEEKAAQ
jgi:Kef-type K+ transport system membrane component KefB